MSSKTMLEKHQALGQMPLSQHLSSFLGTILNHYLLAIIGNLVFFTVANVGDAIKI